MSYVIVVSNGFIDAVHGPWSSRDLADKTADRWNRAYAKRGWSTLRASVRGLMGKDAVTRDYLGSMLHESGASFRRDELLAVDAKPCPCFEPDIDPDTVSDEAPDGICACGHAADEHSSDGTCDGMVLPDAT